MDTWQRRTLAYVGVLTAAMLGFTLAYRYGMRVFEGDSITLLESFEFVVETFTTTGYGTDAGWDSTPMTVLVILMMTSGTLMIFLALPVLLFPLLEEALSTTVPTAAASGLDDHVIVATYTPRVETLIDELDARDVEWVILEPDRDRATELYEEGYRVIHADPDTADGLTAANVGDARALVADVSDQVDASIVLTAKELDVIGAWFDGEFESPPGPDSVIEAGTVLLMTGRED
ncbi:MAG: NAD-binding protein [Halosimplex sp.]